MATLAKIPRKGGFSWKAIVKRRGRIVKTKTFRSKSMAREWARQIEGDLQKVDAFDDPGHRYTVSNLAEQYLAMWSGRDHHRRTQVAWWVNRLGTMRLSEIRARDIREALQEYAAGLDRETRKPRAPSTTNRMKAAISAMLTFGIRRGLCTRNPAREVPCEREDNHRTRYLSESERVSLLNACRRSRWEKLYLLVLMAMMTGARKGELKSLRWEQIDFSGRRARLETTKNGEPRVLTFPVPVMEELIRWRESTGLVFASDRTPTTPFDEKKPWQEALKKAGIEEFRFHDLRHTAGSYLAMGGATLVEIAEILGHKSFQTTKRYAHLSADHKQEVTDRILGSLVP